MTVKEAASLLGCKSNTIYALTYKGLISRGTDDAGLSDVSVFKYKERRRFRRKQLTGRAMIVRGIPETLYERFKGAVPGDSSVAMCVIEAMELWLEKKEND